MSNTLKLLVCGDIEGKFQELFKRVESVQKKAGSFDMLFCVGSFFGEDNSAWEKVKSGEIKVPIDTFVLGPNQDSHVKYFEDSNGCNRITFLGKRGMYTGSSGLSIAYLSGRDGGSVSDKTHFSFDDVDLLKENIGSGSKFHGVDLLLTSDWPQGISKYSIGVEDFDSLKVGSQSVSQLSLALRPRYHFAGLHGAFYERLPYRNHRVISEPARHVTRFIGMAKFGNPQKKKFLYAFNMVPMKNMSEAELVKQPEDSTECPFSLTMAQQRPNKQKDEGGQFFYDQGCLDRGSVLSGRGRGRGGRGGGRGGKRHYQDDDQSGGPDRKKQPEPSGPCWFCLGSPEVEKHLVVSVGLQTYLCLAKGGLTPDHLLITPIGHHQSVTAAPADVIEETEKYKSAIKKCFKAQGKAAVFFERNYKTSHMQIQVVPVPRDTVETIKEIFLGLALSQDIELAEIPEMSDLKQIISPGKPYFYAELPGGEKLFYQIKKGFPLQFGREALAHDSMLNMPERVDWKNCKVGMEVETKMATKFRDTFQKYDFNL